MLSTDFSGAWEWRKLDVPTTTTSTTTTSTTITRTTTTSTWPVGQELPQVFVVKGSFVLTAQFRNPQISTVEVLFDEVLKFELRLGVALAFGGGMSNSKVMFNSMTVEKTYYRELGGIASDEEDGDASRRRGLLLGSTGSHDLSIEYYARPVNSGSAGTMMSAAKDVSSFQSNLFTHLTGLKGSRLFHPLDGHSGAGFTLKVGFFIRWTTIFTL